MRHRKRSRRLVTKWEHRKALIRNLLIALFVHERIKTTEAKAKELRRWADKMITLAKRGDLHARRQALSILPNKAVVRKLFSELRERYLDRESGFTRIVRLGPRRGDAAMMVFIELVTDKLEHKRSPKKIKEEAEAQAMAPEVKSETTDVEEAAPAVQEGASNEAVATDSGVESEEEIEATKKEEASQPQAEGETSKAAEASQVGEGSSEEKTVSPSQDQSPPRETEKKD